MTGSDRLPGRRPRLVVGISGASGVLYGVRLLQILRDMPEVESHLIMSSAAKRTLEYETDWKPSDVVALADYSYPFRDIGAAPASGSFRTLGMVVRRARCGRCPGSRCPATRTC